METEKAEKINRQYIHYANITRGVLDTIKVGDLIKVNDWKKPMRVKVVSDNYFLMARNQFGGTLYSVCSKIPWNGIRHNAMVGGMFHCGSDNWIFGSPLAADYEDLYLFENGEANRLYLRDFEDGKSEISARNAIPIYDLYVKSY